MGYLRTSVNSFIEQADWLGPIHQPMVINLQDLADEVEGNPSNVGLRRELRMTWQALLKGVEGGNLVADEAAEFLKQYT